MVYSVKERSGGRKTIHINSSADGALTDFQIELTITYESTMESDFSDLRFSETNDSEIHFWIESYTASTTSEIWIKTDVPASGGKDVYMDYGDSSASGGSSLDDTFLFGDDFPGTTLSATKWTSDVSTGCSVSVSGGELTLDAPTSAADNTHALVKSNTFTLTNNIVIEVKRKSTGTHYMHASVGATTDCFAGTSNKFIGNGYYFMGYMPTSNRIRHTDTACASTEIGTNFDDTSWSSYKNAKFVISNEGSNNIRWYIDDVLKNQATNTTYLTNDKKITLSQSEFSARGGSTTVEWFFVRKYTTNEPTNNIGSEVATCSYIEATRRKKIHINSSSDGALTDYQIKLTISNEHNMLSHFEDIRFYETNDDIIPFWVESHTASSTAEVWIKTDVPASGGKDVWMYYGNPGFESDANGSNTFIQIKEGNEVFSTSGRYSPVIGIVAYPSGCYYNNKTYVTWQGGYNPMHYFVNCFDHNTREWGIPFDLGVCYTSSEAHGWPAIVMTSDHKILVAYNTHASAHTRRSTNAEDITSFDSALSPCAYANHHKFAVDSSGDIHMVVSYGDDHPTNRYVSHRKSTDNGTTWSTQQIILDAGTANKFYTGNIEIDTTNNRLHITFINNDGAGFYNQYHAYLNLSDSKMYNISGTDLGTTVSLTEADASCRIYNSGVYECYMAAMHLDSNGYPHLIYSGAESGSNNTYYMKWSGSAWTSPSIISSMYNDNYLYHDFIVNSSSDIEAFLVIPHTSGLGEGGDMEKWLFNGSTWSKDSTIKTASDAGIELGYPSVPMDFNTDLKLIYWEMRTGSFTLDLKGYCVGDIDFVGPITQDFIKSLDVNTPVIFESDVAPTDLTNTFDFGLFDSQAATPNNAVKFNLGNTGNITDQNILATASTSGTPYAYTAARKRYKIIWEAAQVRYYYDDVLKDTLTTNIPTTNLGITGEWTSGYSQLYFAFVRKYTQNEPTTSIGTEQHQRRIPIFV